jgi:hypothetical protein
MASNLISKGTRLITDSLIKGIAAAEAYNMRVIQSASVITSIFGENNGGDFLKTYEQATAYATDLQEVFIKSKNHYGTSFVEVLQNCPIFNDGIFDIYTQKDQSKNNIIFLEEGSPIVFGNNNDLTIVIENLKPKITKLSEVCEEKLWIHEKENKQKALILSQLGFEEFSNFPLPFGIIFEKNEKKSKTTKKIQLNDIQLVNIIKNQSFEIN